MGRDGKSYAQELVQRDTGREVPELLRDLYIARRHSQQEIADALGVSRAQIQYWLRQYAISREDRPPVELDTVV